MRGSKRFRDGAWRLTVQNGPHRIYRTVNAPDNRTGERQADEALAALVTEVRARRYPTSGRVTVAQLLDRWLEVGRPDWSPATYTTNRQHAHSYVVPHVGHVPLDRLKAADVDRLYATLRATLSAATVAKVHRSVLGPALNRAVRWGYIASNPAAGARIPEPDDKQIIPPTPEQVRKLIAAAEPWYATLLRVAASTGARRGTLAALRWQWVDLDGGIVRFERALSGQVEKANKGRRAFTATLSAGDRAVLAGHRTAMAERALSCGVPLAGDAFVWSSEPDSGTPYWPSSISREFDRTRTRAKVSGVTFHGLRHFAVTQMLTSGVSPHVVSQRVGVSTATMFRVYAHWVPRADQHAADVMDRLLG
jgi:integrase